MIYTFNSRVRFSEVDHNGDMKMTSLINYLQDCSTFQSQDIGYGIDTLKQENRAWLLASWQIEIDRYPRMMENITIGTQAYEFKSMFGNRNFFIKDASGAMIVRANSVWVHVNMETGKPSRPPQDEVEAYGTETPLEMDYLTRRIKVPNEGWKNFDPVKVGRAQIDTNEHVNNGQYIQMALEYLPENVKLHSLRVDYKRAAVYGDSIYPKLLVENDRMVVNLTSEKDITYCVAEFRS